MFAEALATAGRVDDNAWRSTVLLEIAERQIDAGLAADARETGRQPSTVPGSFAELLVPLVLARADALAGDVEVPRQSFAEAIDAAASVPGDLRDEAMLAFASAQADKAGLSLR